MEESQIILCNKQSDIAKAQEQVKQMLLDRKYPIVKGVPFCCFDNEYVYDLFFGKGKGNKKEDCKKCMLKRWCDYDSEEFEIKALESCDPDMIKFLEDRDENIDDWI